MPEDTKLPESRSSRDVEDQKSAIPEPDLPSKESDRGRTELKDRILSSSNKRAARRFFSAYAHTWIGLSPIWLMGEAITPGTKVGSKFRQGSSQLRAAAGDVRHAVSTSSQDVVVIIDQKLGRGKSETGRAAEVVKAAGQNALLVVTSSLNNLQSSLQQHDIGPVVKSSVVKNGRDVVIILDKALKHPIVVTGVSKFAKSKGIPHAEALLQLASLGLAKIVRSMPNEDLSGMEQIVEEVDAAELEKTSPPGDTEQARQVGKEGGGDLPKTEDSPDPYAKFRRDNECRIT